MRVLINERIKSDGWMTIKSIEKLVPKGQTKVRAHIKRMVAYNMVETKKKDGRTCLFRIKGAYVL